MSYETYVVKLGTRDGQPYAERKQLQVPWHLAIGLYERLSDLAIREFLNDLLAEQLRREAVAVAKAAAVVKCSGYDPAASQMGRDS